MNILILSWRCPRHPSAGGAEQVTLEHAKAWIKAGHKVYWFASNFKGARQQEHLSGVKIKRKGRQFFGVQIRAFCWYFFEKHPKFDLVIDQFHGIPFFTPLYVRAKKLAFIHEIAKEVWRLNPWPRPFNLIPAVLGTMVEPFIFRLFYSKVPFMTVSESTKKDLIDWDIPEKNITIIHSGVKLSLPKVLPPKEKNKTAIFLGAISEDKGIRDALRAFAEIDKVEKGWHFWVVGKATEHHSQKLKILAKNLGISKKIKFWGYVSDKRKFELLARAHALINPSIREGWGLVNIEANAVGTPIVAYRSPGLVDSVKDGQSGIICRKNTPEEMAKEVFNLLNSKNRYDNLRRGAILWSKRFSWEKSTKLSLKLIEEIDNTN